MTVKVISIIPARGGSKGIAKKNTYNLRGIPLIAYTIKASLESGCIDRTIVSTDDEKIAELSRRYGAEVIMRPSELAQDESPTEPVISHILDVLEEESCLPETIFLLQPTSPLRDSNNIAGACKQYIDEGADSLLSVAPSHEFLWKEGDNGAVSINYDYANRPRRQDMTQYGENGAIYIFGREGFLKNQNRLFGKIAIYKMEVSRAIQIDDPIDMIVVKAKLDQDAQLAGTDFSKIKLLFTDVDGVLTDAGIYYGQGGVRMKRFNLQDGMGVERLRDVGIETVVITREDSAIVKERCKKLKIKEAHVGIWEKLPLIKAIAERLGVPLEHACYLGDDVNDLEAMRAVGIPVAVSNARPEIKNIARYVTSASGGDGAFREVSDLICNSVKK